MKKRWLAGIMTHQYKNLPVTTNMWMQFEAMPWISLGVNTVKLHARDANWEDSSNVILYQYSNTLFAIGRFKMEKLSYSCQIVKRACHTFVTYLFAARPGEWRHTAKSPWRLYFAVIQLKRTITTEKLYTHTMMNINTLGQFLFLDYMPIYLFNFKHTYLIRSVAMFYCLLFTRNRSMK